ncbi:MAG: ATP-binding cassette domain-containing protein [Bacilli bacterium]
MSYFEIVNLNKNYDGKEVLKNVNISLPPFGLFGVVGESGSGKSTLLKCISGILSISSGEIYFQGKKIKDKEKFRKEHISFIFQDFELINYLNVKENVALPLYCQGYKQLAAYKEIEEPLKCANIFHKRDEVVAHLSGGEKQRVAIARSLADKKEIILCDEITGSLDESNAHQIMELIKEISLTHLVIMVSHDITLINEYCSSLLRLENKTISFQTSSKEKRKIIPSLRKKCNVVHLAINNLKKGKFRIGASLSSFTLTFLFLLISLSFSLNTSSYYDEHKDDFLDYNLFNVTLHEKTTLENSSLTLVKEKLPNSYDLSLILEDNINVYPSLQNVFSSYPSLWINGKEIDNIEFVPLSSYQIREKKLNVKTFSDVVINKEAQKYLNLGDNFSLKIQKDISYKGEKVIIDTLSFNLSFCVKQEFKEFSFFNTPKIYYSLQHAINFLKREEVKNLSSNFDKKISWYDRLSLYTFEGDEFPSYSKLVEVKNNEKVEESIALLKDNQYEVTSSSLLIQEEFNSIVNLLMMAIEVFMSICIVISFMLFILIIVSFVVSSYQEIGLYKVFGVDNSSLQLMFIFKGILLTISSFALGEVVKMIVLKIVEKFFYQKQIDISLIYIAKEDFLALIILLISSYLISLIPSFLVRKADIDNLFKEDK